MKQITKWLAIGSVWIVAGVLIGHAFMPSRAKADQPAQEHGCVMLLITYNSNTNFYPVGFYVYLSDSSDGTNYAYQHPASVIASKLDQRYHVAENAGNYVLLLR